MAVFYAKPVRANPGVWCTLTRTLPERSGWHVPVGVTNRTGELALPDSDSSRRVITACTACYMPDTTNGTGILACLH